MHSADRTDTPRPLLIANPAAGRGRTGRDLGHLIAAVRGAVGAIDVVETRARGDATRVAAGAARRGRPLVVGLGGDGTLSEIANGLLTTAEPRLTTAEPQQPWPPRARPATARRARAQAMPVLGHVATGTGGDFHRSLGVANTLSDCLAALAGDAEQTIDVGVARFRDHDGREVQRCWLNVLSAGVGGLVDRYAAAAPARLGGRLAYGQAALRAIVVCRRAKLRCRYVDVDGSPAERAFDGHALAICNGSTFGGGMRIAPMAKLDDGVLEVVAFETRTRWRLVQRFGTVYAGTHTQEPGVSHFSCRSLLLEPCERPLASPSRETLFALDVDGDAQGDIPLAVGVLPAALRIRVPAGRAR